MPKCVWGCTEDSEDREKGKEKEEGEEGRGQWQWEWWEETSEEKTSHQHQDNPEAVLAQGLLRDPSPIHWGAVGHGPWTVSSCDNLCQPPLLMGWRSWSNVALHVIPINCRHCYTLAPTNLWPASWQCRCGSDKVAEGDVARWVCCAGIWWVEGWIEGLGKRCQSICQ